MFKELLEKVRAEKPLVHNITNYVVMNYTANALLAIGASPVMAHAEEEVEEMVKIAQALVINIGTLSPNWVTSMELAMRAAKTKKIPIVFDPVGVGATPYRNEICSRLLNATPPTIIRGNASEILAIADATNKGTKGVDSSDSSDAALQAGRNLATKLGATVCISGVHDFVLSNNRTARISNGHPWMSKVTGMGCTATALIGAFSAVTPDPFEATISAMTLMGVSGEIAAKASQGTGSFQEKFLDTLFTIKTDDLERHAKIEVM